jgi:serine phosphatase RsbU (regulator of sigma subunit)
MRIFQHAAISLILPGKGRPLRSALSRIFCLVFFLLPLFSPESLYGLSDFYWEQPEIFSAIPGNFPVSAYNGRLSVVAWQETGPPPEGAETGWIRISLGIKKSGEAWQIRHDIGAAYPYSGQEPAILSIALDQRDRILIAAGGASFPTEILLSDDGGTSFRTYQIDGGAYENSTPPRIFAASGGGYLLFVTRPSERSLYYARSEDGLAWSSLELFAEGAASSPDFQPSHAVLADTDYVMFRSPPPGEESASNSQLFLKTSVDGGRTWSPPRLFTDFYDAVIHTGASPGLFDNQQPHLSVFGENLFVVWERRFGGGSPQVYGALMDSQGRLAGTVQQINSETAYCNKPLAFLYEGEPAVVWIDNRRGYNHVFLAQRDGKGWRNFDLSPSSGEVSCVRPVLDSGGPFFFWQGITRDASRIYVLVPDTSVRAPRILTQNFVSGQRNRGDRARVSWNVPPDPSGIMGFSYLWSKNPGAVPPRRVMIYAGDSSSLEQVISEDGTWYFTLTAQDFAGNWSDLSRVAYLWDTTPPPSPRIKTPELDRRGYLPSNTFSLEWDPPPAPDTAGYTWVLQYLGPPELFSSLGPGVFTAAAERRFPGYPSLLPRIMGTEHTLSYTNQDDGVWCFALSAIDEVGNIGPPSRLFFRTNKYIPHTEVNYVDVRQNELGSLDLRIIGRGFTSGGGVNRILLDQDGNPPYDREVFWGLGEYQLLSDREIAGLRIDNLPEGQYRIGMEHPRRGLYLSAPLVTVNQTGTVKTGNYSEFWEPSWRIRNERRYVFDFALLIIAAIFLFCGTGFIVTLRGIGSVIAESAVMRLDAAALITGDFMPSEKKRRLALIKRRGVGLRVKLASFTIILILFVVMMVSAPLYIIMTRTQRETLLRSLWDRSAVLLEGLGSGARAYLPSGNIMELGLLPAQSAAIPEARYVTITGFGSGETIFDDHVWATNDPDILGKIDTAEFLPGVSRLQDMLSPRLEGIAQELNKRAREEVGDLSVSIAGLTQEAIALAIKSDRESRTRLQDIRHTIQALEARLVENLTEIGREIGSEPVYSPDKPAADNSTVYIFFKPVMFRQGTEDTYFRGLIRLEVSTESILEQIVAEQRELLWVILIVALAAIAIGAIGALIFSTLIIRPIRKLVSHVEHIRDTEDKTRLGNLDIPIGSQDEIAVLGNTINDMTQGLVKAALASRELLIGKEVQKKFIPLELDRDGNKLTSGYKDTENACFFGYYESAKGVSGDYFDYQDLDGRYFAIIKCDVAGKGIPAALIMIQVATMFLNYFKSWKPTERGMHIEELVYQINDFIETLGFKGRFAAFTLCLFDSQTGILRFCNAGDNLIHIFDASEGRIKTIILPETPAAGVLPNFLVESRGGYTIQTQTLGRGDMLLLYTDGIEEAKRKFRNGEFKEILCTEGDAPQDTPHANHVVGQGNEELGADRTEAIINAVMNREVYTLYKYHNPEGEMELQFDFTTCKGGVDELIMALISVEKMFRCYKDPGAGEEDRVLVDKKIDSFLGKHFLQYRIYCSNIREYPGNDAYMYYTHLNEDELYDDLTILGIKRKNASH